MNNLPIFQCLTFIVLLINGVFGDGDEDTGHKSPITASHWTSADVQQSVKTEFGKRIRNDKYKSPSEIDHLLKRTSRTDHHLQPPPPLFSSSFEESADNNNNSGDEYKIENDANDNEISSNNNIQIAVRSKRRFEYAPAHFDRQADGKTPKMIEIVSDTMPLRLHFKSQSAAIVVTQSHMSRELFLSNYNSFQLNILFNQHQ